MIQLAILLVPVAVAIYFDCRLETAVGVFMASIGTMTAYNLA